MSNITVEDFKHLNWFNSNSQGGKPNPRGSNASPHPLKEILLRNMADMYMTTKGAQCPKKSL